MDKSQTILTEKQRKMISILKEAFKFLWKVIKALKKPLLIILGIVIVLFIGYCIFTKNQLS